MDIATLHSDYAAGRQHPERIVQDIYDGIDREGLRPIWISVVARDEALKRARQLADADRRALPLFGIPFAVKDNIDVAGMETTAACPAFAYRPTTSATVVQKLEAAGAILIGKTNMDQFATGLVGTRSPYGACSSVFAPDAISGGSSSGSAVAVASGLVSFALGTDTAGSGRVPAMFNNLVGLKPSRGRVSTRGVVPACRTLDCVSVFAETAGDAARVLHAIEGYDELDSFSREISTGAGAATWSTGIAGARFGVLSPEQREFFGDPENAALYEQAIESVESLGGQPIEIDYQPLQDVAAMLYRGPWLAERFTVVESLLRSAPESLEPTVRAIIERGEDFSAANGFRAAYQLAAMRAAMQPLWTAIDLLLLPTAPRSYTHAEVAAAPIECNTSLGYYTNFVNLLDLAAVAVPAGMRSDGLPFGVSLIGQAFTERAMLPLADALHRRLASTLGGSQRLLRDSPRLLPADPPHGCLRMAVVGAHLSGQPLNWQLTQRGGRLLRQCRTSPEYRFYALPGTVPAKPGLVRVPGFNGPGIEVEVWALPADTVGTFVDAVPPPLAIGTLTLEDKTQVKGFLAEPSAVEGATDITSFGGWRAYLASERATVRV